MSHYETQLAAILGRSADDEVRVTVPCRSCDGSGTVVDYVPAGADRDDAPETIDDVRARASLATQQLADLQRQVAAASRELLLASASAPTTPDGTWWGRGVLAAHTILRRHRRP
jgi:hypothetical protein